MTRQKKAQDHWSEPYEFTGKPVSATTGLYYYFHRWYDPSIGRFISPDPRSGKLSNPQSLNLYIYVLDQPTSLADPSGEWGWNPFEAASNWWNGLSSDQRQFIVEAVVAVAVVAVVVATGGAALPLVLAAGVAGGAINVGVTAGAKLATGQQVSMSDLGHSFLQGFIVGAATAGLGEAFAGARGAAEAGSNIASRGGALSVELGKQSSGALLSEIAGQGADVGDVAAEQVFRTSAGKIARPDLFVEDGPLRGIYEAKGGYASGARLIEQARNYAQLGRDLGSPVYYRLYGGASGPFLDELENLGITVL